MKELLPGVVRTGPKPVKDGAGHLVRNRTIRPCGCWVGEVFRDVPALDVITVGQKIEAAKEWVKDAGLCDVHGGAFAVKNLQLSQEANGWLPPHAKRVLRENASRLLAAEEELGRRLEAGGHAPVGAFLAPRMPHGAVLALPAGPADDPDEIDVGDVVQLKPEFCIAELGRRHYEVAAISKSHLTVNVGMAQDEDYRAYDKTKFVRVRKGDLR